MSNNPLQAEDSRTATVKCPVCGHGNAIFYYNPLADDLQQLRQCSSPTCCLDIYPESFHTTIKFRIMNV